MQKIIRNKLSNQGRRIYGIALKKAKAHNIKFRNCMFGIIAKNNEKYVLRNDKDNCCCIIGACMLNKKFNGLPIREQMVDFYGEDELYYQGLMEGFDFTVDNTRLDNSYLVGAHDGKIMAQRLGLR